MLVMFMVVQQDLERGGLARMEQELHAREQREYERQELIQLAQVQR